MHPALNLSELSLGVCYYPEHWPEAMWEEDFTRMAESGIRYVRIGEFAWTLMEPKEGVYDFSLFDRAMDLAHEKGLKIIFGTPTATPPVWLTQAHPEVLNASRDGVVYRHGMRRHYNYNSQTYLDYTRKIVTQIARHFASHPALWAWQIDNELNCEINVYYSQADHDAFREWCKNKYKTLEALNEAWGTIFWNQIYTDWQDVSLPLPTVTGVMNPHQGLDMRRFISDSTRAYCKLQSDILREYAPGTLITTNGMFGHVDNVKMTQESLDFYCYDSYPIFAYGGTTSAPEEGFKFLDRWWSKNLSLVRGFSPVFAIMEQQSGPGGSLSGRFPAPKPGQMRLWAWQSVAHGADMVSFFRWRTATFGTEIYWHGLLNYGSRDNRRMAELRTLRDEFAKASPIHGGTYQAKVAVLKTYGNDWDGEYDMWHGPLTRQSEDAWFKAAQVAHIPLDYLFLEEDTTVEDLLAYDLLIFPHAAVLTEEEKGKLAEYASRGGKLILGARSGYKDEHGHIYIAPLPGKAADLAGVFVQDFTSIGVQDQPGEIKGEGFCAPVQLFADILEPMEGTVVLARYTSDYYAGQPALTCAKRGEGEVYYFGSAFCAKAAGDLLKLTGIRSPAQDLFDLPETVELAIRKNGDVTAYILLNYPATDTEITLSRPMVNLLTGETLSGKAVLRPYDVAVLAEA